MERYRHIFHSWPFLAQRCLSFVFSLLAVSLHICMVLENAFAVDATKYFFCVLSETLRMQLNTYFFCFLPTTPILTSKRVPLGQNRNLFVTNIRMQCPGHISQPKSSTCNKICAGGWRWVESKGSILFVRCMAFEMSYRNWWMISNPVKKLPQVLGNIWTQNDPDFHTMTHFHSSRPRCTSKGNFHHSSS